MVYSIINLPRSYTTQLHVMFVQISSLDIALLRVKKIILPDFYARHDQIRTLILFHFLYSLSLSLFHVLPSDSVKLILWLFMEAKLQ